MKKEIHSDTESNRLSDQITGDIYVLKFFSISLSRIDFTFRLTKMLKLI